MVPISEIARRPDVIGALDQLVEQQRSLHDLIVRIQQVPAPTFDEAERASFVESMLKDAGLIDVGRDSMNNVAGRVPATQADGRPPLVVSAHLDTVFPSDTDLTVATNGRFIYGPGIGDNSTGLAGIVTLAKMLTDGSWPLKADVWIVANVGEEGLGDLRGMRAVVDRFGPAARYLVVEGGLYGQLSCEAVGVRRYRVDVTGPGGHSWGSFGLPSAIHILGHLIADLDRLNPPADPKTTYNIGLIEGGTSINTIAQAASLWLDLRSEGPAELEGLVSQVMDIIARHDRLNQLKSNGMIITVTEVGNRPAGSISRDAPLVDLANQALQEVGCEQVRFIVSSTDANIPLSKGYEAVCLGLTVSGKAHCLGEHIDTTHLPAGMSQLLLVTLAAAGLGEEG